MRDTIAYTRGFVVLGLARVYARKGFDPGPAFEAVGLPAPDILGMDQMITEASYYALVEEMTVRSGDPFFPARAGAAQARSGLPVLVEARARSHTVGEFLMRAQTLYRSAVTNAYYDLSTDGRRATLRIKWEREAHPASPRVATLNAAAFLTLFRDEFGDAALSDVTAALPDPSSMPEDVLKSSAILRNREGNMILSFPSEWLLRRLGVRWDGFNPDRSRRLEAHGAAASVDFVRERIRARLVPGPVQLEAIATDVGVSARQLQRILRARGTSLRELASQERLATARCLLETTDVPISRIAIDTGFASPQTLSRAFSKAFGQCPSGFRSSVRQRAAPDRLDA